jgi:hypothetical protein
MSKQQRDLIVLECAKILTDLASQFPKFVGKPFFISYEEKE